MELRNKCKIAVRNIFEHTIQPGFMRTYSWDLNDNIDESLIPESISAWYEDSSGEDECASEDLNVDSDKCHTDDEISNSCFNLDYKLHEFNESFLP